MSWQDHPANPLVRPRWWSWLVGDPCVLTPSQTPDGWALGVERIGLAVLADAAALWS